LFGGTLNIVANTLDVIAGGPLGTVASRSMIQSAQTILVLNDSKARISVARAITGEQVVGGLEAGVISSPTTINVSAP